jgi:hypothetical protein
MIYNVYSESLESYRTIEWNTPILRVLEAIEALGQYLIVGDFNLYYIL